jgi:hypothetical protein
LAGSFVAMWLVDRLTKRLAPLAALCDMAVLFTGRAPSRLAVSRRAGDVRLLRAVVSGNGPDSAGACAGACADAFSLAERDCGARCAHGAPRETTAPAQTAEGDRDAVHKPVGDPPDVTDVPLHGRPDLGQGAREPTRFDKDAAKREDTAGRARPARQVVDSASDEDAARTNEEVGCQRKRGNG